ncbi:hypothetical protein EDC04DRAFT_2230603 [Pisolithus marmoratus]|nr:hypothetical protein EDC04DRAFT_2230603 [Pisolithus marmoratus]
MFPMSIRLFFTGPSESQPAGIRSLLHRAFTSPYRGPVVEAFCKYLERNNEEFGSYVSDGVPMFYGKFCSIVQSSGTGKSRLLFELRSQGVVVLYMNLRPSDDLSGFPARDDVPARILTADLLGTNAVDYGTRCSAFFAAVFTMLGDYLSPRLASGSLEDTLEQWNASMCDLLSKDRAQFFATLQNKYETYHKLIEGDAYYSSLPGEHDMINAYWKMIQSLSKLFPIGERHKPKIVIALDEAHTLCVRKPGDDHPMTTLCRAISRYSGANRIGNHAVWIVFVSTSVEVAGLGGPLRYYDPTRVTGQWLYTPYTELGWDQMAYPLTRIAAEDVARADHIIGFGRPLWKSLQKLCTVEQLMAVASSKLSGPLGNKDLPLVTLSQRFCLNFNLVFGPPDTIEFFKSAVASHLCIYIRITGDGNWVFAAYPSEPFLSCAAASVLHSEGNLDTFLKVLEDKIICGMVEVGRSGELASRLLWVLAKDLYIHRTLLHSTVVPAADEQEWNSGLADCQMISVLHYFRFVFGDNFWDRAGKKAKKAFKYAFVNFSHWLSMDTIISVSTNGDDQLATDEWTLRHWHRTSAVQCCRNQPFVDKMIPIYFNDRREKNDFSRVSQIFISDKAEPKSNENELNEITRNHDSIKCHSPRPWVAILVDWGLQTSAVKVKFSHNPADGPCLRIYAAAIDVKTFPFISQSKQLPLTLQNIIDYERTPPNDQEGIQSLQDRMWFALTSTRRHMEWEALARISHNPKVSGEKRKATDSSKTRRKKRKA